MEADADVAGVRKADDELLLRLIEGAIDPKLVGQGPGRASAGLLLRHHLPGRRRGLEIVVAGTGFEVARRRRIADRAGQRRQAFVRGTEVEGGCEIAANGATPGRDVLLEQPGRLVMEAALDELDDRGMVEHLRTHEAT